MHYPIPGRPMLYTNTDTITYKKHELSVLAKVVETPASYSRLVVVVKPKNCRYSLSNTESQQFNCQVDSSRLFLNLHESGRRFAYIKMYIKVEQQMDVWS